jgi:Fur family transcriptional regulator, ferric uptake regulator
MDFESKELTDFTLKVAKSIKAMNVEATNTNFYGNCKKCNGVE